MKFTYILLLAIILLSFSNCKKEEVNKKEENSLISISGTINVKKEGSLNSSSHVFITWLLNNEPNEYIYSEGEIDLNNNSFEINLYDSLPEEAYLTDDFGIGFIIVTNDQNLNEGLNVDGTFNENTIGIAGQFCVIFKKEENIEMDSVINWVNVFTKGYTVGKGIELEGTFDKFEPADNNSVEIIIDDLENIEITNWS